MTRDDALLDELLRLAAAAGTTPDVAPRRLRPPCAPGRRARWCCSAPTSPPRSPASAPSGGPGCTSSAGATTRRRPCSATPCALGAESVVDVGGVRGLARSRSSATSATPARPRGLLVGVLGGSGGAGATTFACALGQVAARAGPVRRGRPRPPRPGRRPDPRPGVHARRPVGRAGPRRRAAGSRALREALPRRGDLGVLTWSGAASVPEPDAVREALSAARRGHDTVVVDLPRSADPVVDEVLARCDRVLVVVTPDRHRHGLGRPAAGPAARPGPGPAGAARPRRRRRRGRRGRPGCRCWPRCATSGAWPRPSTSAWAPPARPGCRWAGPPPRCCAARCARWRHEHRVVPDSRARDLVDRVRDRLASEPG